jgi:hypothetical protein
VPAVGAPATPGVGPEEFALVVEDFALSGGGGWVRLAAPSALAPRFDAEVFSGPNGSNFRAAIESRTPVNGPPELARELSAVVADCTLSELLGDVCSRFPGWAWWIGADRLEIGTPDTKTVKADGTVLAVMGGGTAVRLADLPPRVGCRIELPCGSAGVVLRAAVAWRAGTVPEFTATHGAMPAGRRLPPRSSVRWPAKVVQLDPFQVGLNDEEGRTFHTRARLMARRADGGRFREDLPVQVDDVFEAVVPTAGVCVLPVKVYPFAEATVATAFRLQTHTAELAVAEKSVSTAKEIEETFNRRISRVSQRWDVNKS